MEWFLEWFGEEYLTVYEHRDEAEARREIDTVVAILGLKRNDRVLDLCCGMGRHSEMLAARGLRVIGLDYSQPLLNRAMERKGRAAGYPQYVRADARALPFRGESFDCVVNLFTSFGYFCDEENCAFLASMAGMLRPGGSYFIDYLNPPKVLSTLVPESVREKDGTRIVERRKYNEAGRRVDKTIELHGDESIRTFRESVRLYSLDEIRHMLTLAGLSIDGVLGSSEGEPYADGSDRMIVYGRTTKGNR